MTANRLGLWSSAAIVGIGVAYAFALAAGIARHGLGEPITDPVLAVMEVLTLLSALPIVTLMAAVHDRATPNRKVYGLAALAFATLCAGTTSAVHFVELTAVRQLEGGGIAWPSRVYAVELLAWDVFLGLALVFAAPVFDAGGPERTVRRGLLAGGALCLAGTVGPAVGNMRLQFIGVLGYAVVLPVVAFLLARLFVREGASEWPWRRQCALRSLLPLFCGPRDHTPMTLRHWYAPVLLTLLTTVASGEEPIDRSFAHASWANESPGQTAARVRGALANWKPVKGSTRPSCATPLDSIAGFWIGVNDPTLSCLQLVESAPGRYTLRFVADGHDGGWRMRRTATLRAGLVQLSGPVLDYDPPPYDQFYALAVGDTRLLIPVTALAQVKAQVAKRGCSSIEQRNTSTTIFSPAVGDSEAYCRDLGLADHW